ncbi:MAG TPA: hypothetical protein VF166_09355 [Gemmatimonadaceae bacterium]
MLTRVAAFALFLVASSVAAQQPSSTPPRLYVRHPGPGAPGRILGAAVAAPYVLIRPAMGKARLLRDSTFDTSVIVLGADADVASVVHGDVIVIGGDLFLHPGGAISGRAIAIGGSVYNSALATVQGERLSFPDVTFDAIGTPQGIALDYRGGAAPQGPPIVSLPFGYGFKIPTYTRVDGVSIGWGPHIALGVDRLSLDPAITYRSDIGAVDLSAVARVRLGAGLYADLTGERGTFTNDGWIRSDLTNSLTTLFGGYDYRNYFRADRFEGRIERQVSSESNRTTVSVGVRTERDWSIDAGGPWSIAHYDAGDGIIRPNPPVLHGRLSSAVAGVHGEWNWELVRFTGGLDLEVPFDTPDDSRFGQGTLDLGVDIPTFGAQSVTLRTHTVWTVGDTAPPQRWAYLGGTGSLPTFDILQFGGDRLVFLEGDYNIPIQRLALPFLGAPVVSFRYMAGTAAVHHLPPLEQNVGVGLQVVLSSVWATYTVNPDNGDHKLAAGIAIRGWR